MKKKLTLAILVAASANAAVAGPIEEQIRFRQSAYSFAAWNISKIKSQVVDHPETFNKDSVARPQMRLLRLPIPDWALCMVKVRTKASAGRKPGSSLNSSRKKKK